MKPEIRLDDYITIPAKELGLDLSWITAVENEVPWDGNMTIEQATNLEIKLWSTISSLIDMKVTVRKHKNEVDHEKDVLFSRLKMVSEEKTDAGKTRVAENDPVYQSLCVKKDRAVAFYEWIDEKIKHLTAGHYLCKGLATDLRGDRDRAPSGELTL